MDAFVEWLNAMFESVTSTLSLLTLIDVIDIAFVAFLFYSVYKFIRTRRAGKLALGVAVFFLILILTDLLEMRMTQFLMTYVVQMGFIAVIILFQPELRSALEMIGGESMKGVKVFGEVKGADELHHAIGELTEAVADMSRTKTGALIAIERTTPLGDHMIAGTVLNADVESELIKNLFFNKAPLHDGAVIISGSRIHAAGCLLPLSTRTDLIKELGMRHRAAIGLSENSDAYVIVVSEETGTISVAEKGEIRRDYTPEMLEGELYGIFFPDDTKRKRKRLTARRHTDKSKPKKETKKNHGYIDVDDIEKNDKNEDNTEVTKDGKR
ncbi:MAG: diadenylate cyclase CdaA [Firmicutes bacterium]|nr:diadenylate cyclase CdaA [Bacillota bacterium]